MKKTIIILLTCLFLCSALPGPQPGGGGSGGSSPSFVHLYDGDNLGSTNDTIVQYATVEIIGSDIQVTHSAASGTEIEILTAGRYDVDVLGRFSTGVGSIAILTSTALNNTFSNALMRGAQGGDQNLWHSVSATINAEANDVVWVYYNRPPTEGSGPYDNQLTITGPL